MKNIYKTILVWLLTAVIGSIILGASLVAYEFMDTGRIGSKGSGVIAVACLVGMIVLAISIPAMVIFHLLAKRLYDRWQNVTAIKLMLGLYAIVAIFMESLATGFAFDDPGDPELYLMAVPYAIGALLMAVVFNYRTSEQHWAGDSIIFSSNQSS